MQPYLKVEYIPVTGQKKYCNMMRDLSGANNGKKKTPDYLEATVYSKNEAVIMVGNFAVVPKQEEHKVCIQNQKGVNGIYKNSKGRKRYLYKIKWA